MSISIQKHHFYTDVLNKGPSGDSQSAFLHCIDVLVAFSTADSGGSMKVYQHINELADLSDDH